MSIGASRHFTSEILTPQPKLALRRLPEIVRKTQLRKTSWGVFRSCCPRASFRLGVENVRCIVKYFARGSLLHLRLKSLSPRETQRELLVRRWPLRLVFREEHLFYVDTPRFSVSAHGTNLAHGPTCSSSWSATCLNYAIPEEVVCTRAGRGHVVQPIPQPKMAQTRTSNTCARGTGPSRRD